MFRSKRKPKKYPESSGFDPPSRGSRPRPPSPDYQTVDEVKNSPRSIHSSMVGDVEAASDISSMRGSHVISMNVSDDFKLDSLTKKSQSLPGYHEAGKQDHLDIPPAPAPPAPPPPPPPPLPDHLKAPSPAAPPSRTNSIPTHKPPPAPPVPDHTMATVDKNRNYALFSTKPRGSSGPQKPMSPKQADGKKVHKRKKDASRGAIDHQSFDSPPVFMPENGPVPRDQSVTYPRQLKEQQKDFPGLPPKKVSWNNAVVYNSENKTDIVIAGTHEEESATDGHQTPLPHQKKTSGYDTTDSRTPAYVPGILASDDEGSEPGDRPHRLFTDRQDMGRNKSGHLSAPKSSKPRRRSAPPKEKQGQGDYKCSLCVAVVMLAVAVIGLIVLGTLYGIRYSNEVTDSERISQIKDTFSLEPVNRQSVFVNSGYRPPHIQSQDGATYFLLEEGSFMPWQSPDVATSLTWLQGMPIKAYRIDRSGRLSTIVLGDPSVTPGSQYTLSLYTTDWYALKLLDSSQYALVSVTSTDGLLPEWLDADMTALLNSLGNNDPGLVEEIKQFTRPLLS